MHEITLKNIVSQNKTPPFAMFSFTHFYPLFSEPFLLFTLYTHHNGHILLPNPLPNKTPSSRAKAKISPLLLNNSNKEASKKQRSENRAHAQEKERERERKLRSNTSALARSWDPFRGEKSRAHSSLAWKCHRSCCCLPATADYASAAFENFPSRASAESRPVNAWESFVVPLRRSGYCLGYMGLCCVGVQWF